VLCITIFISYKNMYICQLEKLNQTRIEPKGVSQS